MPSTCFCLFAKPPVAGRSKTRLAAGVGPARAAELAEAFLLDTWDALGALSGATRVLASTSTHGLPIASPPWLQGEGDLGARLERILRRALQSHDAAIAVGADSPGVPTALYERAISSLLTHDAVLGPALDGGFYLLGLRDCPAGLLADLPWSAANTLDATHERLMSAGLRVALLPTWWDVDHPDDLQRLTQHLLAQPQLASHTARVLGLHHARTES